jgi:GT2 family glycosyltransferase
MNSDVFPCKSGWAVTLQQQLEDNREFGILSPRLVFPNGGLQHIGMEPVWREAFGLWTNRHPMMGFDPKCDPAKTLQEVPLVSGACVALRSDDLEAVGGWSTDYLIGDFEDSDLCLALRERGLKAGYLPTVSLTHRR